MIPGEAREVAYAGAGVLWGIVTCLRAWRQARPARSFFTSVPREVPPGFLEGFAVAVSSACFLAARLLDAFGS